MKIAYFVHDLNDAAVSRRVTMLMAGGAKVTVAGFRRSGQPPEMVAGAGAIDLGQTHDAAMGARALSVFRHAANSGSLRRSFADADVIVARNLELLAIALRVAKGRPVVYECLDIHRMLLGNSLKDRAFQWLENRMLAHVDLVWTSSPAFEEHYFRGRTGLTAPVILLENKLLQLGTPVPALSASRDTARPKPPPFVIGWFGMLRCAKTLNKLIALAGEHPGRVHILIAGKPSPAVFPDFTARLAGIENIEFAGAYRPEDLPGLYARCHYAWAIDYYEEGQNSSWLLPNRIYEASAYGAVPIALASVETGRWLKRHDAGIILDEKLSELADVLAEPDDSIWRVRQSAVKAIKERDLVAGQQDCDALVGKLRELVAAKAAR